VVVSLLFPQIVSTKKADGKTYRYIHIVESYRDGKTVKKRRIASLGNIDEYSEKEIEQIILKLNSLLQNRVLGSLNDLDPEATLNFGVPYVVQFLWDQFGLTKAIGEALRDREMTFDVSSYIQAMVINRLIDPSSKMHLFDTIKDLYMPQVSHEWQLQHFYRALDYLMDIKPQLERFLYHRLTDLFNLQLSLVLYDLTSAHVTGHHCPIAAHGYTRTHRPDLEQVELGLLVTPEGLPITHEVFSGETPDKITVPTILKRLKEEFAVKQCVFVGDRGMVTDKNLILLVQAEYPYIVGYHKRGRIVSDALLETYTDVQAYVKLKDNLSYLEVPTIQVEDDSKDAHTRYILCYNPVKAVQDKAFRTAAMDEAEKALTELQQRSTKLKRGRKPDPKNTMVKVAEILTKKGVKAFFEVEYDGQHLTYNRNEPALGKEALRDGKFVVKTNTKLPPAEVVLSYKTLMNVERAFREIKNFLEVGPLYHWNAKRVRGHIFICVLAYLFEQELQVLYRRRWLEEADKTLKISDEVERVKKQVELNNKWFTGESIVKELARWHVLKGKFLDKAFLSVPPPTAMAQQMLTYVGIPLPAKIIHLD
jgi:transposase